MKVNIGDLGTAINDILGSYQEDVFEAVRDEVKKAAKIAKKEVQGEAPHLTGAYKKSWRISTSKKNTAQTQATVYAAKPEYRLTHLLENGHAKRGGGRTRSFPHIGPAQEAADAYLEEALKQRL